MSKKRQLPEWMNVCKVRKQDIDRSSGDHNSSAEKNTSKSKSKEERKTEESIAFNRALEQSLPELKFTGSIIYSYNKNDCNVLSEDIELSFCDVDNAIIGFDMEWPVTFQKGKQDKTSLLQLCTSLDNCYLFHLSCFGILPSALCSLLLNKNILKVGINIESDLWKLERDYDIQVMTIIKNSMIDLGHYANKVLKTKENWSLEGLAKHLFKCRINKDPVIRKGNWTVYPLTDEQKSYAATDAFVSYKIYKKLKSLDV